MGLMRLCSWWRTRRCTHLCGSSEFAARVSPSQQVDTDMSTLLLFYGP
jgi:hypothetical protein